MPSIGDRFDILTATGFVFGEFETLSLPAEYQWKIDYFDNRVVLEVLAGAGDYNGNGAVDAPDYTVWRDTFGSTFNLAADGNANGVVDVADYVLWRDRFDAVATGVSVPEPLSWLQLVLAVASWSIVRKRRLRSR